MDETALIAAAIAAMDAAYAPYSRFAVGAALYDEKAQIHRGANVENAAYPQGSCAEAAAITAMILGGGKRIAAIAIAGGGAGDKAGGGDMLCTPCGGCRQRIREFAAPDTPILIADSKSLRARFTLDALLPHSFGPDHLHDVAE